MAAEAATGVCFWPIASRKEVVCIQSYRTLGGRAEGRIIEKKSEFIGAAAPVETDQQAVAFLEEIRAAHRTARHHVYAYQILEGSRQRYSDDGEPAKTAGLPVLSVITHAEITNCIIVVTRYFGGTLLGTGGLVRAYTAAAKAALESAEILTVQQCVRLKITIPYPQYEPVCRVLEAAGAKLQDPEFTDLVLVQATLLASQQAQVNSTLHEMLRGQDNSEWSQPFFLAF